MSSSLSVSPNKAEFLCCKNGTRLWDRQQIMLCVSGLNLLCGRVGPPVAGHLFLYVTWFLTLYPSANLTDCFNNSLDSVNSRVGLLHLGFRVLPSKVSLGIPFFGHLCIDWLKFWPHPRYKIRQGAVAEWALTGRYTPSATGQISFCNCHVSQIGPHKARKRCAWPSF